MSSKSISSLSLPQYIILKLHHASIYKISDLINKTPLELVKLLNVCLPKVDLIFEEAFKSLPKVEPINPLSLIESNEKTINLDGHVDHFDQLIYENQLIRKGLVCELCGPPGVGKTQFTMQICVNHLFRNSTVEFNSFKFNSMIIYIDTENNFSPQRLLDMASSKFNNNEQNMLEMTKHVLIFKAFDIEEFEKVMSQVELSILKYNVDLLIIDSLASIVRREFVGSDPSVLHERALFLFRVSSSLKTIAQLLDVAVLVTNQITTYSNKIHQGANYSTDSSVVVPALGISWTHFINIRVILQFFDDQKREILVAKSPLTPFVKYSYHIEKEGLLISNENEIYDGTNPNYQNIKTKPFASSSSSSFFHR